MVGCKQPGTRNHTSSSLVVPYQAVHSRDPGFFAYAFPFAYNERPLSSSWQILITYFFLKVIAFVFGFSGIS